MTDDILMLRRFAFPDGLKSSEDALELLALNEASIEKSPQWAAYLVESLAMFVVYGSKPEGLIDENKATWLMRTLSVDGAVKSALELEVLLHAMELACEVPEDLSAFALDQLRLSLEPEPRGAYHEGRPASDGITNHDLIYIWRILRGALERGRLMLSPLEATVLKHIDELADPAVLHSDWHTMIASIVTLDRPKQILRSDRWLVTDDQHLLDEAAA
ncbi:hypothetical protein KX729_25045 [Rhizobium sp. XQZ8]|uniref:hypothetical protein n=1 Tax=Rhizobium populisoli TaxID=2859785 RepID=UPI001CA4FC03|nr:hypothetical protein [Rhizobium populisoli]MBW6424725.1 hypothetical protein [Rhizobium populisoli]